MADDTYLEDHGGTAMPRAEDTVIEGGVAPAAPRFGYSPLPPSLVDAGYQVVRRLGVGAEATVWLCSASNGYEYAIKVYFRTPTYAFAFDSEDYQRHFAPAWTVEVFHRGFDDVHGAEVHYEVMEYCAHGTLDELLGSRPGSDAVAATILGRLAYCVQSLQGDQGKIVHGDVKPRNILVRDPATHELVLSDFGLTIDLGERSILSNNGQGTTAYNAPEIMRVKGAPADWWSVGMVMYTVLVGRGYYQIDQNHWANQHSIEADLISHDVSLDEIDNLAMPAERRERWKMLLAGLLTRDPDRRWSATDVQSWLEGQSPRVYRPLDTSNYGAPHQEPTRGPVTPFPFAGVGEFSSPSELGRAMAERPADAARMLAGKGTDRLVTWLRDEARTGDDYSELRDHSWDPDAKVAYFVARLAPTVAVTFRSKPIGTPGDLRRLVQELDTDTVNALYTAELLGSLADDGPRAGYRMIQANWHDLVHRAEDAARTRGVPTSTDVLNHVRRQALLLAASDAAVAQHYVADVQRRLAGPNLAAAGEVGWFARLRADAGI